MTKLVAMVALGALFAGLSGCTTLSPMSEVAALPKKADGIMFAQLGGLDPHSAESICAAFPGVKDERCEHKDQYDGMMVVPSSRYWKAVKVPLLAPKSAGVSAGDIVKIRVAEGHPAYFEFIAAKGTQVKDCYYDGMYGPHSGGPGGVVCPKYNWDYKRDLTKY
ncbi:MAG TPA: hypothetical protein VJ698_03650 [Noviherbaspirillum sp.]|uniref:hypothetical protein n=1 Tax=Noviherbaspirillum sp. TaxID=1926288 RepID=UPI002B47E39B|nr:hypothetical protein [Noviherbaspirillum sp.]HJV84545.1 hypothetical protein [Noviherbaspirillum sp.]